MNLFIIAIFSFFTLVSCSSEGNNLEIEKNSTSNQNDYVTGKDIAEYHNVLIIDFIKNQELKD